MTQMCPQSLEIRPLDRTLFCESRAVERSPFKDGKCFVLKIFHRDMCFLKYPQW